MLIIFGKGHQFHENLMAVKSYIRLVSKLLQFIVQFIVLGCKCVNDL